MPDEKLDDADDEMRDEDRLLPGEDPATTNIEDAEHWFAAYAELLGFKHDLVNRTEIESAELSKDVRPAAHADLSLLQAERERLQRRYDFWKDRVRKLASS